MNAYRFRAASPLVRAVDEPAAVRRILGEGTEEVVSVLGLMRVPDQIRDAMVAHARFTLPEEACGLLAADDQGRLRMAYCLTNVEASPTAYTLDPMEHFRALRHAERAGWDLVGVFHSHPQSEGYPSPTDVRNALEPDWLYVVVGLRTPSAPQVRGFRIRDGRISEEPLEFSS